MDISLLKTFLEVARTGHFGKAAAQLCVTQSAVSARIKLLEATLGMELLTRKRNDIRLTAAGNRLRRHAETIVKGWERARQELALGEDFAQTLAVGCNYDLWQIMVRDWTLTLRERMPELALQIELHAADALLQRLVNGVLDLAFMFEPPQIPALSIKHIAEVPLVMVSTVPGQTAAQAVAHDYIMVDWGTSFEISHAEIFPDITAPALRVGLGAAALELLLERGGSAYLARQMVNKLLEEGKVHLVADAPILKRNAYAVLRPEIEARDNIRQALAAVG